MLKNTCVLQFQMQKFQWRISGKKEEIPQTDKMTQAFQMSAIIKVEHKMVSFVLPQDNALAAAQPRHLTVLAMDSSNVTQ